MVQDFKHELLCRQEACEDKNLRCIDNAYLGRSWEVWGVDAVRAGRWTTGSPLLSFMRMTLRA